MMISWLGRLSSPHCRRGCRPPVTTTSSKFQSQNGIKCRAAAVHIVGEAAVHIVAAVIADTGNNDVIKIPNKFCFVLLLFCFLTQLLKQKNHKPRQKMAA
jgi:fucose permease